MHCSHSFCHSSYTPRPIFFILLHHLISNLLYKISIFWPSSRNRLHKPIIFCTCVSLYAYVSATNHCKLVTIFILKCIHRRTITIIKFCRVKCQPLNILMARSDYLCKIDVLQYSWHAF